MLSNEVNGLKILTIESDALSVSVIPALGGKISGIYNKSLKKEFLWINDKLPLKKQQPGAEYDPNFIGGVDELIPNDIPEKIDGIDYPDHGELWTTPLDHQFENDRLTLSGLLPLSSLYYNKTISLDVAEPAVRIDYLIRNDSPDPRHFMWKLHAALTIQQGGRLQTSAGKAQVVDPQYSRFKNNPAPFAWPSVGGEDASVIPAKDGTMDFFHLFDTPTGEMKLLSADGTEVFGYSYDTKVFPYQWYFASYGGFLDHYTAILEPCTTMPLSVNDAILKNQTAKLLPGESISTTVNIYAGPGIK